MRLTTLTKSHGDTERLLFIKALHLTISEIAVCQRVFEETKRCTFSVSEFDN
jgi:hypothetical protein